MAGTSAEHRKNPHISDEEFEQDQSAMIKDLVARIKELEDKLSIMKDAEVKASTDDHDKLKPIDIKDIERPDKYDNQAAKCKTWFDKLKDLLTSRHGNWEKLRGLIENRGNVSIKSQKEFINSLDDATYKSIKEQSTHEQHLKSYLRIYIDGELHARVIQTDYYEVMELMREVIHKGRNRNPNRLINFKAKALSPRQANKASYLDKILTEWRHTRKRIVEEDPKYQMDDETMQTILLKIMHPEYVKDMREQLPQGKHEDDYFRFEQALFDDIHTNKMDEESRKKGGRINVLNNSSGDDDKVKRNADGIEYELWRYGSRNGSATSVA